MAQALTQSEQRDVDNRLQSHSFDTLKEMIRHGYAPDNRSSEGPGTITLRHPSGPDLVLLSDGRLELPHGQAPKARPIPPSKVSKPSWRRALFIILLLAVYTFVSLAVISTFISS